MKYLFCVIMLLAFIPPIVLLAVTLLQFLWGFFVWRRMPIALVCAWIMLAMQLAILWAWVTQCTASAAFRMHPMDPGLNVIPPQLETLVMSVFWYTCVILLPGLLVIVIIRRRKDSRRESVFPRADWWIAMELFMIVCLWSNLANVHHMPDHAYNIAASSPDNSMEVRLVPMDCEIDINGIVLIRSKDAFFWHPVDTIGDSLTAAGEVDIKWSDNSTEFTITGDGYADGILMYHRVGRGDGR